MQHHFDVEIAERYGLIEAILLDNFWFWIKKNEANEKNYHDGEYWTYNSTKALTKLFPYLTQRRIQNALGKLIENEILITGNYNSSTYDRTLWYAFTEKGKSIMQKREMDYAKKGNGLCEKGKPIPYTKPDDKTNIYSVVPDDIKPVYMEWVDMRKKIKKPVATKNTVTRSLNKLKALAQTPQEQIRIIERSIDKCWTDFYPLDSEKKQSGARNVPEPPKYKQFEPEKEKDTVQMPDEIRAKMQRYYTDL